MDVDDNNFIRLFGFKVTLDVAVILSFVAVAALLHCISWIYNVILFLLNTEFFILFEFPEYFKDFFIELGLNLFLLIICIYLLVKMVNLRKTNPNNEKNENTWFRFSLTLTSITVLTTLSVIGLIESLLPLYHNTDQLIEYLEFTNDLDNIFYLYLVDVIQYTILLLFYIYTLIRCNQIRSSRTY
ncbi:MAG: hypothetical protein KGD58_03200 [Candidatus Lokiarchaeota archaeon]|nr:hypothetical protein [Candidatus Lokiarchaeota archaeon]